MPVHLTTSGVFSDAPVSVRSCYRAVLGGCKNPKTLNDNVTPGLLLWIAEFQHTGKKSRRGEAASCEHQALVGKSPLRCRLALAELDARPRAFASGRTDNGREESVPGTRVCSQLNARVARVFVLRLYTNPLDFGVHLGGRGHARGLCASCIVRWQEKCQSNPLSSAHPTSFAPQRCRNRHKPCLSVMLTPESGTSRAIPSRVCAPEPHDRQPANAEDEGKRLPASHAAIT
jgi:hypothetical protein